MSLDTQPTPRLPEPVFTVQEWLAQRTIPTLDNKPLRYAKWWISKQLARVSEQIQYLDFDGGHKLYVTFDGDRYRVTGVSRHGILTLRLPSDPTAPSVNYHMTSDAGLSEWSNTEEGPLNESKFVPYSPGQL